MFVNIQKAIELTGVSRSTIQRHIKTGKLTRTDKGIDTAELIRVYGEFKPAEKPDNTSLNDAIVGRKWLISQIESLQTELKQVKSEAMERERLALEREKLANEREARLLALIENKSTNNQAGLFTGLFKK